MIIEALFTIVSMLFWPVVILGLIVYFVRRKRGGPAEPCGRLSWPCARGTRACSSASGCAADTSAGPSSSVLLPVTASMVAKTSSLTPILQVGQ